MRVRHLLLGRVQPLRGFHAKLGEPGNLRLRRPRPLGTLDARGLLDGTSLLRLLKLAAR